MRIPIDFSVNDADATGEREGILTYSINNQDKSYSNVSLWTYTWIGDKMTDVDDNKLSVNSYELSQNYPNPFNPSTVISYSLEKSGMVSLKIYNILGQEVMSLVNATQNAGQYQVKFDASQLSTGLYIYRIQSGNFVDSKKMMLLK
ncbi:MAG: T9SS type A sorting domain-containing protein [Bacteroidetes bacterium]|nr:T9SS type A sorting domain-containing protein [Bacteroidota bacterium]MBU1116831.1 T9SS type A sorting domain-containing protein [Bacteroidota bacterium]MBU1796886.1 T9SS type A sorting domain-containing protein [Bacteroidota bacterium]